MTAQEIPVDTYEDVLDTDLPLSQETVPINRRGYAEDVADVLGPDYLGEHAIVFTPDQLAVNGQVSAFPTSALDALADTEPIQYAVDRYGPVGLSYDTGIDDDITVTVRYAPEYSSNTFVEAKCVVDHVNSLDMDDAMDADYVNTLSAAAAAVDPDDTGLFQDPIMEIRADRITIERDDRVVALYDLDEIYGVTIGADARPLDVDGFWQEAEVEDWLSAMQDADRLERHERELAVHTNLLAKTTMQQLQRTYFDPDTLAGQAEALEELRTSIDDAVPDTFDTLQELRTADDLSIDSSADWKKAAFLSTPYDILPDTVVDAREQGKPVTVWRYEDYDTTADQLADAYYDWKRDGLTHRPERHVPLGTYGAETVNTFCDQTDLGEKDGIFLTALINNMVDNEIVLDDMSDVEHVGYELAGKQVQVDGGTGSFLGKNMRSGRIEVMGRADPLIGGSSSGGEIWLHTRADIHYQTDGIGADIYRKQRVRSWLSTEEQWEQVV
jgi:hypothetical protein